MSSSIFYRANASFSSLKTSSSSSLATGIVVVASSSNPSPSLPAGPAKKNFEKLEEEEEEEEEDDATTIAATDKKVIETRILPFIGRCLHLSHQDHKNHENPGFAAADEEREEEKEGEEEGADIRDLCIRMCEGIFFPPKSIRLFYLGFYSNVTSHRKSAETTRVCINRNARARKA